MKNQKTVSLLLRLSIAFTFFYAAIAAFIAPQNWIGFLPTWISIVPIDSLLLLQLFSGFEIILGLLLVTGKRLYFSSIVSAIVIASIILLNIGAMDIVFRDVPILFACIALAVMSKDQ